MARIANVSPDEWQAMLRRSKALQPHALYDQNAAAELKALNLRIRALGKLPADGS